MALRLNLYHEVIKAKALKRRDPLKISIYVLSGITALCTCWYVLQVVQMSSLASELAKVKGEFRKLEPQAKAAKKREDELANQAKLSVQLEKRMEGRFYWAPVLAQIMQIVPREVQVTRMGGDVSGEGLRRCIITIDGLSAGSDPRKVAEDLRTALAEKLSPNYKSVTSTFKTLEDGTEMVMLDGKQMPTATFAINVQLYAGEEKSTAPVRGKKR
jgi:hypothetical protein